jgi:hypothetical protein
MFHTSPSALLTARPSSRQYALTRIIAGIRSQERPSAIALLAGAALAAIATTVSIGAKVPTFLRIP